MSQLPHQSRSDLSGNPPDHGGSRGFGGRGTGVAVGSPVTRAVIALAIAFTMPSCVILKEPSAEMPPNIPPVVVVFIFFFFLSEQIISALNMESWARGIARSDNNAVWTFFFGDMRRFPALISGVIVLALFESAFVGEIVRAGIQSIDKGQREAARSIGMSRFQELRYIVLPQALRKVLPPMANQFISLVKDSSLVSLISVPDLTFKTVELVASTRMIFEAWLVAAAFYFVICFGLSMLFRRLENG